MSLDFEQVNPAKEGAEEGKAEEVSNPAESETSIGSERLAEQPEDSTADGVSTQDDDSPRDGLRMLALSVISQAVREDRSWFFASRTQTIFKFWATVAGLNPSWVQQRIQKPESGCPGLRLAGRTWFLQMYDQGTRYLVRLGKDLCREEAVRLGLEHKEAAKAKVMAASS